MASIQRIEEQYRTIILIFLRNSKWHGYLQKNKLAINDRIETEITKFIFLAFFFFFAHRIHFRYHLSC